MKRLIVYDLDGTLADTLDDIAQSANQMLRQLRGAPVAAREIRRLIGRGVRELVRGCLKTEDERRIALGVRVYLAHYAQHLLDHTRLYPGTRRLLDHFRCREQAVLTNKPNPFSQRLLEALGIAGYFSQVVAGDSAYPRKPDPTSLRALIAGCGVSADEAAFIGDSPVDVETGKGAGVLTVATEHGFSDAAELAAAGADVVVRDFAHLLALVRQQGW
jgi:phosphoglycolate phosphatase